MGSWGTCHCIILGLCEPSAARGYPLCRLLALHFSIPNVHVWSCRSCTACGMATAVSAPTSISWAVRLLLSVVPNGDYLVGTWYLCSGTQGSNWTSHPTSLQDPFIAPWLWVSKVPCSCVMGSAQCAGVDAHVSAVDGDWSTWLIFSPERACLQCA